MERRALLQILATSPVAAALGDEGVPRYRVLSGYKAAAAPGMPGPWPGRVTAVHSERVLDSTGTRADAALVRDMMDRGMCLLTGLANADEAWRLFFTADDVVGIKVNCGGYPFVVSAPEIVAETVRRLQTLGLPPERIFVYERFQNQLDEVDYGPQLPKGVGIVAAESRNRHSENGGYDPEVYVEADFFGEEDTRSNLMSLVSRRLTKIINIPNMKDHGATGVTGCLKNIAYGSFSNVARTHAHGRSHTRSFVGTLCAVEPLRSRTVLQIMDGLRAVWHGGPFARSARYVFHPRQILFGTDPVAIDRLLLDIIEDKRRAEGARSIWDRSADALGDTAARDQDPNVNILIREPGHVEFASDLGLGVSDRARIDLRQATL
jgi:hypothetical protein